MEAELENKVKVETNPDTMDLKTFNPFSRKKSSDPFVGLNFTSSPDHDRSDDGIYSYDTMLAMIHSNHPDQGVTETKHISVPTLATHGARVCWTNVEKVSDELNRDIGHLSAFIGSELGVREMSNTERGLLMKGRVKVEQLVSLISKYVNEFVKCKGCKGMKTVLRKENRMTFVVCECGSKSSVPSV